MKVLRDILTTLSAQIIIIPFGMVNGIILARALNPAGKGIYTLAVLIPGLIVIFSNMGIASASIYLVGKKKYSFEKIFGSQLVLSLVLSLLGIAIFELGMHFLKYSFRDLPGNYLIVGIILVPFLMLSNFLYSDLFLQKMSLNYSLTRIAEVGINMAGLGILSIIGKLDVPSAVILYSMTTILITVILYLTLRRNYSPILIPDLEFLRELFSFGMRSYVTNLANSMNVQVDQLVVGVLLLASDLGQYALAVSIANMLWLVSDAVKMVLGPSFAQYSEEDAIKAASKYCRNLVFFTFWGGLGLGLVSYFLIPPLYGEAFRPAIYLILLLLPGVWIFAILKVLPLYWSGLGKPEMNIFPLFMAVSSNIPLNMILLPLIGIRAAAINSTISYTLAAGIHVFLFMRKANQSITDLLVINQEDITDYKNVFLLFTTKIKQFLM